jgi:hypothetical protein
MEKLALYLDKNTFLLDKTTIHTTALPNLTYCTFGQANIQW